jgi:hypothetical protein
MVQIFSFIFFLVFQTSFQHPRQYLSTIAKLAIISKE